MSDQLFDDNLLEYITRTTDKQWNAMDLQYQHYFSTPSLDGALSDLEAQWGATTPTQPVRDTTQMTLKAWIGDVTLASLQQRIARMNTQYQQLRASSRATDAISAWTFTLAVRNRCNDLAFLGVYLYGFGIADGLYDQK